MPPLILHSAESAALQRALNDIDFRNGLTAFFESTADYANQQCAKALVEDKIHNALLWAAEASAAGKMFTKFEEFTREQLTRT